MIRKNSKISRFSSKKRKVILIILMAAVSQFSSVCQSAGLIGAYEMPYTRYEADAAQTITSATEKVAATFDQSETAAEASGQKYIELANGESAIEWEVATPGDGVTLRFTLPDSDTGGGLQSDVDVYINDELDQTVVLSSYYSWQYFENFEPSNDPGGTHARMRFDEVHFRLGQNLVVGDKLKIKKKNSDSIAIGIDFIELEEVPALLAKPEGFESILDHGAIANDGVSDLGALNTALSAANNAGTGVYIPEGQFDFDNKIELGQSNIAIQGAGMWYTTVYFTNAGVFSGGIFAYGSNLHISDFYMNTVNNRRFFSPGTYMNYKGFMGTYGSNSVIKNVWAEHFEVGAWVAGYSEPVAVTDNLTISHVRFRNNYADGVNFAQGTSYSVVEHSSIRNNGDDGLAIWTSDFLGAPAGRNNIFRFNTIENNYRAGGMAMFGGRDHMAHNLLIKDCFGGAGIRFTTDFPGHSFSSQGLVRIADIEIENCGTSADLWDNHRGAVELNVPMGMSNFQFDNIVVKNAQRHGVQAHGTFSNVKFTNITVDGVGADGFVATGNKLAGVGVLASGSGNISFNIADITNYIELATLNTSNDLTLTVSQQSVPVESISFSPVSISLEVGETSTYYINFTPANSTNKNIAWLVSDSATVAASPTSLYGASVTLLADAVAEVTATSDDGNHQAILTNGGEVVEPDPEPDSETVEGGSANAPTKKSGGGTVGMIFGFLCCLLYIVSMRARRRLS